MQIRSNLHFIVEFRKFVDKVKYLCEELALLRFDNLANYLGITDFSTQKYQEMVIDV